jgi:prepilin-type N-terminal cleavage/methylation domain-containing protein/prepilin-type processing-associated H-X9-DG protein
MERKKNKGFTLVELLVVIAIIALLLSILVPALRKAKNQAMRVYCGNNIKQVVLALGLYAAENRDYFPLHDVGECWYWLWGLDKAATAKIMKYGPKMESFYCPANIQQKRFKWQYWAEWSPDPEGEHIIGYFSLWDNPPGSPSVRNWQPQGSGSKKFPVKATDPRASETELFVDVTFSNTTGEYANNPQFPYGNFAKCGGGMLGMGTYDCSNHYISESKCEGGNAGFVDGHVEWRNFTEMEIRTKPGCFPTEWW